MVRFNIWALAAVCLILASMAGAASADDASDDKLAKEIHGQLYKAIKAKELDGVMKLVDVPWFGLGKEIVKDEKELKKRFKELLDSIKDTSELKSEVKEVLSYSKARDKFKKQKNLFKLIEELKLTENDRVIIQASNAAVLVRIRDGKAKVVGIIE